MRNESSNSKELFSNNNMMTIGLDQRLYFIGAKTTKAVTNTDPFIEIHGLTNRLR